MERIADFPKEYYLQSAKVKEAYKWLVFAAPSFIVL